MGITEDKRKQYEEAAKEYVKRQGSHDRPHITHHDFMSGCKHAHSKIEEAERAILSDVFTIIENHQTLSMDDGEYKALEAVKEELKRLMK